MKSLLCALFMLVIVNTLQAVPPSVLPDPVKVVGGTAYVVHVVDCELPDYWINAVVWKKTASALADSLYSFQALITRPCSTAAQGALDHAFYPALRNSERELTYAVTDSFGTLRSSNYFVGRDVHTVGVDGNPPVRRSRVSSSSFQELCRNPKRITFTSPSRVKHRATRPESERANAYQESQQGALLQTKARGKRPGL